MSREGQSALRFQNMVPLLFLAVLIFGLTRPARYLVAASCAFGAFGSLAIIPTELTGGVSVLAGSAAVLFLWIKVALEKGGVGAMVRAMLDRSKLGLLAAFTLVALVGSAVLPRLFAAAYEHDGFWHPMDTLRDKLYLEELWVSGSAPWKTWA